MSVQEALHCKEEGNTRFSTHRDIDGAIDAYERGIAILQKIQNSASHETKDTDADENCEQERNTIESLLVTLYCNLANAFVEKGQYDKGEAASQKAIALCPSAIKPWIRYVDARRRNGFPFDALVQYWLHLRPLLQETNHEINKKNNVKGISDGTGEQHKQSKVLKSTPELTLMRELCMTSIERPLYEVLGLERVVQDVELVEYMGGVAMVARRSFKPNEVLFVEHKYHTAGMEHMSFDLERALSTECVALHFAEFLRPHQITQSSLWQNFTHDFIGAWPRSLAEIDAETQHKVGGKLLEKFPELHSHHIKTNGTTNIENEKDQDESHTSQEYNELLMFSLMCRYNCFYSGFFRTCALANHSCRANIAMKYNHEQQTVTMMTVSYIAPGELMNVKYLSDLHFLMGLGKRREYLRSWLFWCHCDRCKEDCKANAIQEHIRCSECQHYTHLPFPANYDAFKCNDISSNCNNNKKTENVTSRIGNTVNSIEAEEENEKSNAEVTDCKDVNTHDPLIVKEEKCMFCNARVSWTEERVKRVEHLLAGYANYMYTEHNALQLGRSLHEQLILVRAAEVHPCNWIYRIVFFYYCILLTSKLNAIMESLHYSRTRGARVDGSCLTLIKEVLLPFKLSEVYLCLVTEARDKWCTVYNKQSRNIINNTAADDDDENDDEHVNSLHNEFALSLLTDDFLITNANTTKVENELFDEKNSNSDIKNTNNVDVQLSNQYTWTCCDALKVFVIEWHLIADFYPPFEMWSIHHAICQLVLLQLLFAEQLASNITDKHCKEENVNVTKGKETHNTKGNNNKSNSSNNMNTFVHDVLRLLQRHGPYLEQREIDNWFVIFNAFKTNSTCAKSMAQYTGKLKQAFKGK